MINGGQRVEMWFWAALPSMIAVILMVFCLAPKHMGDVSSVMPLLPLMPIFYWGMMHARDMPYWMVFIIGLATDAVQGLPLGLSPVLYMGFLALLHAQRKYIYKEGFVIKWGYFATLIGLTTIANWMLLSFLTASSEPILSALIQWLLTVACYPLLHRAFDGIYEYIHARRWRILHGG